MPDPHRVTPELVLIGCGKSRGLIAVLIMVTLTGGRPVRRQASLSLSLSLCLCALASLAPRVVSRLPRAAPLARSDRGRAMM